MSQPATSSQATEQRARWKWFLALGAILLVLGMAGIGIATLLQFASLLVFGPLLLISGVKRARRQASPPSQALGL
jgi:uncharacterized membrane protein HdeD (DUF308 family)